MPRLRCLLARLLAAAFTVLAPAGVAAHGKATINPLAGLEIAIPYQKYVLPNGLTLIVHEDHSAPFVATNIWYHVGSANEPKGKSGFAHLFEHLMFNGSEHFNDDFFKATQKLGATDQNGSTAEDRTDYYQTVPTGALDSILWLESDRMGHLLGAIDQARLDEQRAVVKNEKRQGENAPFSGVGDLMSRALIPPGHPYDHSVIGSTTDLDGASLIDVKQWFRDYYGPNNAVLVLAGDINFATAKAKVEKYFGEIAPGPPVAHLRSWPLRRTGTIRETTSARIAGPAIYRVWNGPPTSDADADYLRLLAQVLTADTNSRLYDRLLGDADLATSVGASMSRRALGGQFLITAAMKPGRDPGQVEHVIDEELRRIIHTGATQAELDRVRTPMLSGYVRALESLSIKAAALAEGQTYADDPGAWRKSYERLVAATPADLQRAARRWLSDGDYVLNIHPYGSPAATGVAADRTVMPVPASSKPVAFPEVERATLSNGIKLALVHRSAVPIINMTIILPSGVALDWRDGNAGLPWLIGPLLTHSTTKRPAERLTREVAALGAQLGASVDAETSSVSLSTLTTTLEPALTLYADVIVNPTFDDGDVERQKASRLAELGTMRMDPGAIAQRLAISEMFGADQPYGQVPTAASLAAITPAQLKAFHARWFRPDNATLVIVGDTNLQAITPMLERAFGGWRNDRPAPPMIVPANTPQPARVLLVNKPGAPQSVIRAVISAPPRLYGDELARLFWNNAWGGSFTSRLNMKLREEKGWAYGASSGFTSGHGGRLFGISAAVQTDKTAEAMAEIAALANDAAAARPITAAELERAKTNLVHGMSGNWSSGVGIARAIADQIGDNLPANYYADFLSRGTALTLEQVNAAGIGMLRDQQITWVVVGDRAKIEAAVRSLKLGDTRVVDADGLAAAPFVKDTTD